MRSISRHLLVLTLSAVMMVSVAATGWAAEKIELKFACEYTDKHPTSVNAFIPWIKQMEEMSKGRLVIQFFNPNTICPAKEVYNSTVAGAVDIGASPTHWLPGKFVVSEAIEQPFLFNGSEAGSMTAWEIYKRFPEWREEYKDVKMLWQWTSALNQLHTVKKPVRTLEDLQGMKILSWAAPINAMLRALGANPIDGKPADTYMSLERGMADGVICPIAPMRSFKITDAAKHHTVLNLASNTFWGGMNQKKWNSLPPDLQKLIEESTGDKMALKSGKTLDEGSIADGKWMKENKHKFYVLDPKEKEKWVAKVKPITEEWIKRAEQKGYKNARSIYETAVTLGKENSQKTTGGYVD